MSTLQLTLVILGVVIILAVVAYNQWYSLRHAPRKPRKEPVDASAAAPLERREPDLGDVQAASWAHDNPEPPLESPPAAAAAPASGLFGQGKSDSVAAAAASEDPAHATASAPYGAGQPFDSLVFSIVPLALDKPVSGDAALAALPPTRRIGKKQFLIHGLNVHTRSWEPPRAGARYSAFEAAIQLANRQGALNEIEFSEFVLKTQAFADEIGAAPDFPDMLHEVARGREVDAFAAQNDAVLNLMLSARRATWSPGYIRQCAARYGFKPSVTPGRLTLAAANPIAPPVLTLNYDPQAAMADDLDHAPIHEILFTLDVPNVDRAESAFPRLRQILEELAETMEGTITDPEGRKLPAMAMDSIAADVERLYDALEARGFPAGSPAALKLFS
ncbi:hypothetical protein AAV94_05220 [Lampropedia cohaerens]|uniref:ZipA C-terminal FtsZ-binding domain-containing protein n=1 Tax=Lampropedia cohaerens TaxID=1610491 RepID=A0A0U1Q1N0_9BURK|nr:hypothetical protein [Lampropedia cohaerens]KKW68495.1 hypothetical protein AAV94_05220 [Lampropedia cohaerens]